MLENRMHLHASERVHIWRSPRCLRLPERRAATQPGQRKLVPLTDHEFHAVYPLVEDWIQNTLAEHATNAKPVASFGFNRLPDYFDPQLLASSKVVVVPRVPMPPLTAMGLDGFRDFEQMDAGGIAYLNTYFVRADYADIEALHFHELVHVLQWRLLGPEKFLALYADGLERFGYRDSPLEVMAYNLQDKFDLERMRFDVESVCRSQVLDLISSAGMVPFLNSF